MQVSRELRDVGDLLLLDLEGDQGILNQRRLLLVFFGFFILLLFVLPSHWLGFG